ncbi:MAG: polyprenyl synthetase family protein [Chloroflexi bacterium]|nr:polyprenyl synthetase family protein [Chloroflexota bacterium]
MTTTPEALSRYHEVVQAEMRAAFPEVDLPIYDMGRYALGWMDERGQPASASGKGARAALTMLGAEAITDEPAALRRATAGAAAVEIVHNFSLVHDDVQDGDIERRGRPTVWRVWGVAQAINTGDLMRELADTAMRRALLHGASSEAVLEAIRRLNQATMLMIEGQYLDLTFEQRMDVQVEEYLAMVERKTGAMMGVSLSIGATLAGATPEQADALDRAGKRLGRCFQMRDDWLGIWADPDALGKPTDADIRRRKKSFPILYTLSHAPAEARRALVEIYAADLADDGADLPDEQVEWVHNMLGEIGADEATDRAAREEYEAFLEELSSSDPRAAAVADLEELARFTLERDR